MKHVHLKPHHAGLIVWGVEREEIHLEVGETQALSPISITPHTHKSRDLVFTSSSASSRKWEGKSCFSVWTTAVSWQHKNKKWICVPLINWPLMKSCWQQLSTPKYCCLLKWNNIQKLHGVFTARIQTVAGCCKIWTCGDFLSCVKLIRYRCLWRWGGLGEHPHPAPEDQSAQVRAVSWLVLVVKRAARLLPRRRPWREKGEPPDRLSWKARLYCVLSTCV